jgi:hypothetical protein
MIYFQKIEIKNHINKSLIWLIDFLDSNIYPLYNFLWLIHQLNLDIGFYFLDMKNIS